MSDGKKEFLLVNKLVADFISNLSNLDYEKLLRGEGVIKFVEKDVPNLKKNEYNDIMANLIGLGSQEMQIYLKNNRGLKTKSDINDFCSYFGIDTRSKDKTDNLIFRIIEYIETNKSHLQQMIEKKNESDSNIENVALELESSLDLVAAKELILTLNNKAHILKLAKRLDVHLEKDVSYELAVDQIVQSVVGSKIRSLSIRRKL